MRALASPLRRSVRLIVPAAAFLTLVGGTAAVAAPAGLASIAGPAGPARRVGPAGPAASAGKLTWHGFTLLNGWKSASKKALVTGQPAWAFRSGIVYFRGAITQPSAGGSSGFARLPSYARPAHNLYLQIYTTQDTPGILYVGHDGTLEAYDGNARSFASLAAVSYLTSAVTSHKLTLKNGWASSQSNYGTGDPSYAISGGVVYLSGSMHGTGASQVVAVLPKAERPAHDLYISVYAFDGATGSVLILPTGEIKVSGIGTTSYTSLANISYPAAGAKWHNFSLLDGWKSGFTKYHTATPAYVILNGIVYLNGSMFQVKDKVGLWAELPAGVRTAADVLEIEVYTAKGTAGGIAVTDSLGLVSSMPFSNAQTLASLAAIAYPQSS